MLPTQSVAPSAETAQDGSYTPLARPLFIYVNKASYADNEAVQEYVDFYIENLSEIAEAGKAELIPAGSEVDWRGDTTTVLDATEHDDGGMGAPQHTEVVCE